MTCTHWNPTELHSKVKEEDASQEDGTLNF